MAESGEGSAGQVSLSDKEAAWVSEIKALIVDDSFYDYGESVQKMGSGRGRPKSLPKMDSLTVKTLLQLAVIKVEGGHSYSKIVTWLQKNFPDLSANLTKGSLQHKLEKTVAHAFRDLQAKCLCLDTLASFVTFPDSLQEIGLSRDTLLQSVPPTDSLTLPQEISVQNLVDLEMFRVREKMSPQKFIVKWAKCLIMQPEVKDSVVLNKIDKTLKMYKKLRKKENKEEMHSFLHSKFTLDVQSPSASVKIDDANTAKSDNCVCSQLRKEMAKLQTKISILEEENLTSHAKFSQQVETSHERELELVKEVEKLKAEIKSLKIKGALLENKISKPKKMPVTNTETQTPAYRINGFEVRKLNRQLQKRLSAVQIDNRKKVSSLQDKISRTEQEVTRLTMELELKEHEIKIKEGKLYTDDVRTTVLALMAETNVPASKVHRVMEIVGQHLFHTNLQKLPCMQTAVNILNEGHVLSKRQVAEELQASASATLHLDGTSREKQKYVGTQVTLHNGANLSLGFYRVAQEDSQTLLDKTVELLEEIRDIYCFEEDTEEKKKEILSSVFRTISSLMTDRAAAMKAFGRNFHNFRTSALGEELTTNFLHCNAHYLLGVESALSSALTEIEKDMKLGRDLDPRFTRFKDGGPAAYRVIRLTADLLGPRGDEKNGCREEWLEYCSSNDIKSTLTGYRVNRFNNLFQNAGALILHHQHILAFLKHQASATNLKVQSVVADLGDPVLLTLIAVVALFGVRFTTPYWRLMQSNISYAQFPAHVQLMLKSLAAWKDEPHLLLDCNASTDCFSRAIPENDLTALPHLLSAVHNDTVAETAVPVIISAILKTTASQLSDFYGDGKYAVLDDDTKSVLEHCPLTNLVGEHAFGDLDFDMSVRRHAGLHLRSSLHMLKRNKTVNWLEKKDSGSRKMKMSAARKMAIAIQQRHKTQEEVVKFKIKEKLLRNERERMEKEAKEARQKEQIMEGILKDGLCKTSHDVDMLEKRRNKAAIVNQIKYHKYVMGVKVKHLNITGRLDQLAARLKSFLIQGKCSYEPPCKRRKLSQAGIGL